MSDEKQKLRAQMTSQELSKDPHLDFSSGSRLRGTVSQSPLCGTWHLTSDELWRRGNWGLLGIKKKSQISGGVFFFFLSKQDMRWELGCDLLSD